MKNIKVEKISEVEAEDLVRMFEHAEAQRKANESNGSLFGLSAMVIVIALVTMGYMQFMANLQAAGIDSAEVVRLGQNFWVVAATVCVFGGFGIIFAVKMIYAKIWYELEMKRIAKRAEKQYDDIDNIR